MTWDAEKQAASLQIEVDLLKEKLAEQDARGLRLAAEVDELVAALERAYEFLGMMHLPDQESSVPGRTTCPVCVSLDIVSAAIARVKADPGRPVPMDVLSAREARRYDALGEVTPIPTDP